MRFPIGRTHRLTFVMLSGARIEQVVWSFTVRRTNVGDVVTETAYSWAGKQPKAIVMRADQIAAVLQSVGPLKWRGFKGK